MAKKQGTADDEGSQLRTFPSAINRSRIARSAFRSRCTCHIRFVGFFFERQKRYRGTWVHGPYLPRVGRCCRARTCKISLIRVHKLHPVPYVATALSTKLRYRTRWPPAGCGGCGHAGTGAIRTHRADLQAGHRNQRGNLGRSRPQSHRKNRQSFVRVSDFIVQRIRP